VVALSRRELIAWPKGWELIVLLGAAALAVCGAAFESPVLLSIAAFGLLLSRIGTVARHKAEEELDYLPVARRRVEARAEPERSREPSVFPLRWRGSISIGSDGILVTEGKRTEMIPMVDLEEFSAEGLDLRLVTRSGTRVLGLKGAAAPAAARAIHEQERAHRESRAFAEGLAKGEDKSGWLARLRGERDGYRETSAHDEALWQIVEAPAAEPTARAAAALLLRENSVWTTERLRIAASGCASPKLRVALQEAAAGEEAKVDAALAELDAERAAPKRS